MTLRLIMRVGEDRFAMSVDHVVRAAPAIRTEPMPLAANEVEGLAVYGGDVVPQMDLARTVGMPPPHTPGRFVTLARTASGLIALRHDGFDGVHDFPDSRLAPVAAPPGDCRTGMIRLAGRCIFAVDARRIRIPRRPGLPQTLSIAQSEDLNTATVGPVERPSGERFLRVVRQGVEHAIPLEVVRRIEGTGDGGFWLVLRSGGRSARLGVERVLGTGTQAEGGELTTALLAGLSWMPDRAETGIETVNENEARHAVFRLVAGGFTCAVRRRDVRLVSQAAYAPASWAHGRFDGLAATSRGILPIIDLTLRLGDGRARGSVCVAFQTGDDLWGLACDRVADGGNVEETPGESTLPWCSVMLDLQGEPCPLLDLNRLIGVEEAA